MSAYRYDLHLHSCLSPCADDDMTPYNIAGMAMLLGLQLLALTDHNSAKNCPAFFSACREYGLVPVPGMELCTAEEIHLICLFPSLADAMAFDAEVETTLSPIKNRPEVFGRQWILREGDTVIGEYDKLLIAASALPLSEAAALCEAYNGACFPAHIDRMSNGILGVLGVLPESPRFTTLELSLAADEKVYAGRPDCAGRRFLHSSDAHRLDAISEGAHTLRIADTPYSGDRVRRGLIELLRKGKL